MTNFHNIYLSVIGECATGFGGEECDLTNDALAELLKRLMDAERDAERYRWLRDCNWNESAICAVVNPKGSVKLGTDCPSGDRLDSFIDEAMQCKQK